MVVISWSSGVRRENHGYQTWVIEHWSFRLFSFGVKSWNSALHAFWGKGVPGISGRLLEKGWSGLVVLVWVGQRVCFCEIAPWGISRRRAASWL